MLRSIIFNVDEELIRKAREKAARERISLNESFGAWLWEKAKADSCASQFDALMQSMDYVRAGQTFRRDEMNER